MYDKIKTADTSGLKLFDWDTYGSGPWSQFSSGRADRDFNSKTQHVLDTKNMLLRKGYDGISVHESGMGYTKVIFDEAKNKLKYVDNQQFSKKDEDSNVME